MKQKLMWLAAAGGLALLLLAGCQTSEGPQVKIEEAWGRPSPAEAMMGAFYMVIKNEGSTADALIGGSTTACGAVELHESYMSDNNVMGMRPVAGGKIEVPAKGQVELKPGGLHMMCINKQAAFEEGNKIQLTLQFEQSGEMNVEIEIRQP